MSIDLALIVADGDVPAPADLDPRLLRAAADGLVICADGGLHKARQLGLRPGVVIGDGDSLDAATLAELRDDPSTEVVLHPAQKDESDTQLALLEAVRRGARHIVVLGALGGIRFDHSLANVLLLALPELAGRDVALVDAMTQVQLLDGAGRASLTLDGSPGDLVSLLPLSERVTGATTAGLRYALDGEDLAQGPARGLSNELITSQASIRLESGRLAVIHTRTGGST